MTHSNEKRLFNRFDQYEIASIFTQSAEEFLSKRFKSSWRRFILKCIICILLAVNGYLVQWGPFSLPSGYYFVVFSVIFYHLGSWIYERLNDDKDGDVSLVGDYFVGGKVYAVCLRAGKDFQDFFLEVVKQQDLSEKLPHADYFTVDGFFLEEKFKKVLERFTERLQKQKAE